MVDQLLTVGPACVQQGVLYVCVHVRDCTGLDHQGVMVQCMTLCDRERVLTYFFQADQP